MSEQKTQQPKLPGSNGEHALQLELGSEKRALGFYNNQMLDYLNPAMREFITKQSMMFIASSDAHGECDCSFRAGGAGFVWVVDQKHIMWPEYRGNGVVASGGNVKENPHMGILFMDFLEHTIGLHINGKAFLREDGAFDVLPENVKRAVAEENATTGGKKPSFWFLLEVEEAYIHCAKHIPHLVPYEKSIDWGTDDVVRKGGDFFKVKAGKKSETIE
ncbi:MAG: pyridoxamine 5'-phosphate oxidase family protein [Gammaproteobacteria bacterium]|nr:pyridoxamine 5'-phosphate oxidase family protein [Gammaproteobacteria bacterium]MBU1482502.1 pyridoxamine 5'-phosphate oxidase family protein [Gammaproteobacteria bacterium]